MIPLLVAGIFLFQAALWTILISIFRKRRRERLAALNAELQALQNEPTVSMPTSVRIRRGHASMTGVAAVTSRRVAGRRQEISLDTVKTVRTKTWFNGNARGGYRWVILSLTDGNQVGVALPRSLEEAFSAAVKPKISAA